MANWSVEPQPFGANHAPLLTGWASDGSGAVPVAVDKATGRLLTNSTGASGGTSSTFGVTFPATGTAVGAIDTLGNMAGLNLDGSGNLKIAGSFSVGGTTDNSAFTAGTSTGTPAMGFYHSTIDAVTDGRSASLAIDAKRNLFTVLRDAAGNARGVNVTAGNALTVDGSASTQPVSGTFWQATQPISAASLPLPTLAATSTKQPALGTAGTASADVITVQGIASMTALKTDASATTQPVSGTFWQATQPVSGTVTTAPPANASTNIAQFGGSAVTIGQQLAAASIPVILPSATITTLTPPAAITGFALDATLTGGTQRSKITDGTNNAAVKAASTAPVAADPAVVIANSPNSAAMRLGNGITEVSVSGFGALNTSVDPWFPFNDTFSGVVIDTVNWVAAGTVAPTQNGAILVNPGATASATSSLVSNPTFTPASNSSFGAFITLEVTTIATGNYRTWGNSVAPSGVGTSAAPTQDGSVFEVDTSGVLRASIYSAGTRIFTQVLTVPVDGAAHLYVITYNAGITLWYKDTFTIPVASTALVPNNQVLPVRIASLNSGAVTGTPTMSGNQVGMADFAHQGQAIVDGTYGFRKATVSAAGALKVDGSAVTQPVSLVSVPSHAVTNAGTFAVQAAGDVANAATDSGSPVKVGGKATSTPSAVTTGQRVDALFDLMGRLSVFQKSQTATLTNVASSATNVTLLAANVTRIGAQIYNDSTQVCYVKFGVTASSTSFTVPLATNTYYEVPGGYQGQIDGIWVSSNGSARVTELT